MSADLGQTHYAGDGCDPPHPLDCLGGAGINVDTVNHLAQCPGPCGTWFTTMMDEPVFPPHRVIGTTIDWGYR